MELYPDKPEINPQVWFNAPFQATPSIIEAARHLYYTHTVEDIKKHDSTNLTVTIDVVNDIIKKAKEENIKAICFVTGVPGAGKTLVGLTVAVDNSDENTGAHAAYLSGNGPLVAILKEALARDIVEREGVSKAKAKSEVKSFIGGIYQFRKVGIENPSHVPQEQVVIFDEAQRAWTQPRLEQHLRKKGVASSYALSEPESLIEHMNRRKDCTVIICLIGGGQEINSGETGLAEWFKALKRYNDWKVYVTPQLNDPVYLHGANWAEMISGLDVVEESNLHLSVSMRTMRTDALVNFVDSLLALDYDKAKLYYSKLGKKYPLLITRDLNTAKSWIKSVANDDERYGRLVSSVTESLLDSPDRITRNYPNDRYIPWILNDKNDPKSSYNLDLYISEFNIQGLEIDYALVEWGPDFRFDSGSWKYFNRTYYGWEERKKPARNNGINGDYSKDDYTLNSYRVLLTRARRGMIIYIPRGDSSRTYFHPEIYAGIYELMKKLGIKEI